MNYFRLRNQYEVKSKDSSEFILGDIWTYVGGSGDRSLQDIGGFGEGSVLHLAIGGV